MGFFCQLILKIFGPIPPYFCCHLPVLPTKLHKQVVQYHTKHLHIWLHAPQLFKINKFEKPTHGTFWFQVPMCTSTLRWTFVFSSDNSSHGNANTISINLELRQFISVLFVWSGVFWITWRWWGAKTLERKQLAISNKIQ